MLAISLLSDARPIVAQKRHFNESRVRRKGATTLASAAATGGFSEPTSSGVRGVNSSSRKGIFKLRFVHRGASLQTALTGLVAKLKYGSPT